MIPYNLAYYITNGKENLTNKLKQMISLCILPNFTGTISQTIKATLICLILDSTYLIPCIYYNI